MEKDENIPAQEKRQLQLYASHQDVLVQALDIPEADYQCVTVNGSWLDKGLIEGDIVLCKPAEFGNEGDIVLIEEDNQIRLGLLAMPGFLQTFSGTRPLEVSEKIVGVGVALARKLGKRD